MPNWKKVIVSGSEASLSNIFVDNNVTASFFTGSFKGDGTNLQNVPFDDGLPDNDFDYNIPDSTPINDFLTASTQYLIDFNAETIVGTAAGDIGWLGNSTGETQILPTTTGLVIIASNETQGKVTSNGYSGSIVGIGNVQNYSSSINSRLVDIEGYFDKTNSTFIAPNHNTNPASPQSGSLYFNTSNYNFYGWNGNAWVQLNN